MKKIVLVILAIILATYVCIFFVACEGELPTAEEIIEKLVEVDVPFHKDSPK